MANPTIAADVEQPGGNSFTKPAGVVNGSVLEIIYWQFHGGSTEPTPPAGFTKLPSSGHVGTLEISFGKYRKVVTDAGSEPVSYTVTRGSGTNFADGGAILRLAGVDTTTPEDSGGTGYNEDDTAPLTGTATSISMTTTVADVLLLALIACDGVSIATPAGMTLEYSHDGGDAEIYSQAITGTLSGSTRSSTLGGNQEWGFAMTAVAPPGGGGTPAPAAYGTRRTMTGGGR